jgi:SOS-response transcriptional repressor LexA
MSNGTILFMYDDEPTPLKNLLNRLGITNAELARRVDKPPQTVGRWVNGERAYGLDDARDIARALNVTVAEVALHEADLDALRAKDLANGSAMASLGVGANIDTMPVVGDAMVPTFGAGDVVIIDKSSTSIVSGDIYAIRDGDAMAIRRLEKRADGSIEVYADNARIRPRVVSAADIQVLGRVSARIHRI